MNSITIQIREPDKEKMEQGIRRYFFKNIQLDEKEWKKVAGLAAVYRNKM